jgi:hypothetical protein
MRIGRISAIAVLAIGTIFGSAISASADTPSGASGTAVASSATLSIVSQPGDDVGQGQSFFYTAGTASDGTATRFRMLRNGTTGLTVYVDKYSATGVRIAGWVLLASMPGAQPWHTGSFATTRFPDSTHAGFDLGGGAGWGEGCNQSVGSLNVNSLVNGPDGAPIAVGMTFEQHCIDGSGVRPGLTGSLTLGRTYDFSSDAANLVGRGDSKSFSTSDSSITGTYDGRNTWVTVSAPAESWTIELTPPRTQDFVPGTTYGVDGSAHNNTASMKLTRNGVSCSPSSGTLRMDDVTYLNSDISSLSASFDLVCQSGGHLAGHIHFND